jgi:hypothetical protein
MEDLKKLAEERALERFPNRFKEDISYDYNEEAREGFIIGFLEHAQLAAEDKKELLEALKSKFYDYLRYYDKGWYTKSELLDEFLDLIKKHETI